MAIKSQKLTVTTTRQALSLTDTDDTVGCMVWIHNHEHATSHELYVGGPDVTSDNGLGVQADGTLGPITLAPGETLYLVSAQAAGIDARVLIRGC